MKRPLPVLCILLALASCQQPDFHDAAGDGHRFGELRGKWLIVNYWATWCGPCKTEIPELNRIAKQHADRLNIYGVDFDAPAGDALDKEIEEMKIEFPVFEKDPSKLLGYKRPQVLPTTFVFSPEGKLVKTLTGPQTEESLLHIVEGGSS